MAIIFFNLNRGPGAGSGGIMTLDNGLTVNVPGNGQLGGNLLHPTQIGLNGQTLEIVSGGGGVTTFAVLDTTINQSDGVDQSFVQVVANGVNIESSVVATNDQGNLNVTGGQVQTRGANGAGTTFSQTTTNQAETDIVTQDPATGRGEALVTAADIHLNVQDIPGIANAGVDIQQDRVVATAVNTGTGTGTLFVHPDEINATASDGTGFEGIVDVLQGEVDITATDGASGTSLLSLSVGQFILRVIDIIAGNTKSIQTLFNDGNGIQVTDDIDNIGLTGATLFPINNSDLQYVQAGHTGVKNSNDTTNSSVSLADNVTYNVPAGDGMFLISAYSLFRSGLGSVDIVLNYTDVLGNAQVVTYSTAPVSAANTNSAYPAIFIKAQNGSTVTLSWNITGVITFDGGGAIQYFGA